MTRAISVVLAVLVLLGIGWFVGNRPSARLRERVNTETTRHADRVARLEERVGRANAEALLWQASTELLLAAGEARDHNFGDASRRAGRALDLITRAGGQPGVVLEVGLQRDAVDAALRRLAVLDPRVHQELSRIALDIAHLIEGTGRA